MAFLFSCACHRRRSSAQAPAPGASQTAGESQITGAASRSSLPQVNDQKERTAEKLNQLQKRVLRKGNASQTQAAIESRFAQMAKESGRAAGEYYSDPGAPRVRSMLAQRAHSKASLPGGPGLADWTTGQYRRPLHLRSTVGHKAAASDIMSNRMEVVEEAAERRSVSPRAFKTLRGDRLGEDQMPDDDDESILSGHW